MDFAGTLPALIGGPHVPADDTAKMSCRSVSGDAINKNRASKRVRSMHNFVGAVPSFRHVAALVDARNRTPARSRENLPPIQSALNGSASAPQLTPRAACVKSIPKGITFAEEHRVASKPMQQVMGNLFPDSLSDWFKL